MVYVHVSPGKAQGVGAHSHQFENNTAKKQTKQSGKTSQQTNPNPNQEGDDDEGG